MRKTWITICLAVFLIFLFNCSIAESSYLLNEQEIQNLIQRLDLEGEHLPAEDSFRITIAPNDLSVTKDLDGNWIHILLLGTDTGNIKLNYGRSDAMIVASFNRKTYEVKLSSLVRDMLVDIPGLQNQNRINTANAFGGPLLAMKRVDEVLGLTIIGYASVNFRRFIKIVDNLGGVEIELEAGEAGILGVNRGKGKQLLNGEQTLGYSRIRQLDNNFGRNERQRKVLDALFHQMKGMDFGQVMKLLPELLAAVSTNVSAAQIISLLPVLVNNGGNLGMLSLPSEGSYHFYRTQAGASVVTFDTEAVKNDFHNFIQGISE